MGQQHLFKVGEVRVQGLGIAQLVALIFLLLGRLGVAGVVEPEQLPEDIEQDCGRELVQVEFLVAKDEVVDMELGDHLYLHVFEVRQELLLLEVTDQKINQELFWVGTGPSLLSTVLSDHQFQPGFQDHDLYININSLAYNNYTS